MTNRYDMNDYEVGFLKYQNSLSQKLTDLPIFG